MGKQNGNNEGHIINIASLLGVKIKTAMPVYCATKHGVVSYTKTMAVSYNRHFLHQLKFFENASINKISLYFSCISRLAIRLKNMPSSL